MDEDGLQLGYMIGEDHLFQISPVLPGQLGKRAAIHFLQLLWVSGLTVEKKAVLVISEKRDRPRLPGQGQGTVTVGAMVDQIPQHDDLIGWPGIDFLQKLLEFLMAAMNISDGDVAFDFHRWVWWILDLIVGFEGDRQAFAFNANLKSCRVSVYALAD